MTYHERNIKLTEEQKTWFGDRMSESGEGRVIIPTHLYKKFKKITDLEHMPNHQIKCWLIDYCYN